MESIVFHRTIKDLEEFKMRGKKQDLKKCAYRAGQNTGEENY